VRFAVNHTITPLTVLRSIMLGQPGRSKRFRRYRLPEQARSALLAAFRAMPDQVEMAEAGHVQRFRAR
jgi:hypothetical protein